MHGKSVLRMIAGCLLAVAIMGAYVPEVRAVDIGGFKARANARAQARVARAQANVINANRFVPRVQFVPFQAGFVPFGVHGCPQHLGTSAFFFQGGF